MFCKYCGSNISGDEKFCPSCGKLLEDERENKEKIADVKDGLGNKLKSFLGSRKGKITIASIVGIIVVIVAIIIITKNYTYTITYEDFVEKFNETYNQENGTEFTGDDWRLYKNSEFEKLGYEADVYRLDISKSYVYAIAIVDRDSKKVIGAVISSDYPDYPESELNKFTSAVKVSTAVFMDVSLEKAKEICVKALNLNQYEYRIDENIYIDINYYNEHIIWSWSIWNDKLANKVQKNSDLTNANSQNTSSNTTNNNFTTNNTSTNNTTKNNNTNTTTNSNPILYDEAKILSEEESKEILNILSSASGDADIAMVFLTTDTDDGTKDSQLGQLDIFVESYYNNNLKDKTQAKDRAWILGYDNNSKQFVMRSFGDFEGEVHLPFTTYERKQMSENIEQALNNKSYVSAVKAFVNEQ